MGLKFIRLEISMALDCCSHLKRVSSGDRIVIYKDRSIKTNQTSFVINEGNSVEPVFNEKDNYFG